MQPQQLNLTFEPGLAQRNRSLRDHLTTRIYGPTYGGLVAVAGKLDLSPSKLSEKLTGQDSAGKPRGLTVDELERYIVATGDLSPVHYLADKYLRDPAIQRAEAVAALANIAEQLPALMAIVSGEATPKRGRR